MRARARRGTRPFATRRARARTRATTAPNYKIRPYTSSTTRPLMNGPTPHLRIDRGDHAGGRKRCTPDGDPDAAISPPADCCFARCDSGSAAAARWSTADDLAICTLRRFSAPEHLSYQDAGSGVNSNRRRPPTPPIDTRTGRPTARRAILALRPRAKDASQSRHSSANTWLASARFSPGAGS